MSNLWRLIQSLTQGLTQLFPHMLTEAEHDEAYLAGSVDRYDLEWRMLEIDRRHHRAAIGGHWNLGAS
jgi:hypothetical protein